MNIGIIGLGFVGNSIFESFKIKIDELNKNYNIFVYDKFKNGGIGSMESCIASDILFLALPTPYDDNSKSYRYDSIIDTCIELENQSYSGVVVIKSTVEPTLTDNLSERFPSLQFIHNPEFLTARTAFDDFHNQTHIVLGKGSTCSDSSTKIVYDLYRDLYPSAKINTCKSTESESMKIFCNTFYAVKIQYFNELYLLCKKIGCDYDVVRNLMLENKWINPMHTDVPGPDGKLSYGGLCFPKDTNALLQFMISNQTPSAILSATIEERNIIRDDNDNCI